ncbi:MAG: archease [Candidatus Marsarchaeota archaeon]|jgi:SHS2 domain-containing protein|nr:archease [Candidatus Marsarchaeota archaeon]MCL5115155.1 archease [Candidatus Marsarchaeota archaeon]
MRKGYLFKEHTADVEFIANGASMDEAFKNAILAMLDTIADIYAIKKSRKEKRRVIIKDSADNAESLLWVALQDTLSATDSKGVFGYEVEKLKIMRKRGKYSIYAIIGTKEQEPKYSNIYVKGVSRFDMEVKNRARGYTAKAVLDV